MAANPETSPSPADSIRLPTGDRKPSERFSQRTYSTDYVIDPRKLAAIHITTLGPTFAVGNFASTALLCLCLGTFLLWRANTYQQLAFGFYFVSLSINYLLMLLHALEITSRESARAEIGSELNSKRSAMAEYRRQSIYLLLPLVVPIVALQRRFRPGNH